MDVSSETYIRLTEEDLGKLDVIQSSIEEATTHRQLVRGGICLLYTSPSPRDQRGSRMPSSA